MTGGIIQLASKGVQDLFLTQNPQITFFKIVYRRYTNFTTEVIKQPFTHKPQFGKRITCILSRNGDLMRKVHVVIDLPTIPQFKDENQQIDVIAKFAWVRRIGYAMIKTVDIEIGDELIDRQYGDWLNIWHELTISNKKNLSKMIGDIKELTDFSNGKKSYRLFVPLQFWFNRIAGLALPIVSLQYNHIKINVELNALENVYLLSPTHYINIDNDFVNFEPFEYLQQDVDGVISQGRYVYFDVLTRRLYLSRITDNAFQSVTVTDLSTIPTEAAQDRILYRRDAGGNYVNDKYFIRGLTTNYGAMPRINSSERSYTNRSINFKNIQLKDCFLLVEYIFLDDEERIKFYQARHDYLIEQIFFDGEKSVDGLHQSFKLGFTQPCKELIWITQLSLALNTRNNDLFNYTDSLIRDMNGNLTGNNLIVKETIVFNGHERVTMRESEYFSLVQPYQHHSHNPQAGINVYSFSLFPEKHQPSGTANLSKIDNINLRIVMSPIINFNFTAKLRVYCIVNNILRIANGISGLVFAIDF